MVLLCVTLDPVFCRLLESTTVLAILVGNGWFNSVVGVGLDQECLDQAKHRDDFIWWLPLLWAKKSQAHGTLVVVAHIGVVYLGSEANDWWLEWVFDRECDFEFEVSALATCQRRDHLVRKSCSTYCVD
jgi:hypothetical protein